MHALPQVCCRPPLHLAGQLGRSPLRDEALRQDHRALGEQVLKSAPSLPAFTPASSRLVSVLAMGEGFHNYHHTFPYDYSTSEWGFRLNVTTRFIDTMAWLGQAYDLR